MAIYVKPGNTVEHDGVLYGEGQKAGVRIDSITDDQARALLQVHVVQTLDPQNGVVPDLLPTEEEINTQVQQNPDPTPEEIAALAEQQNKKRGLFGGVK